MKKLLLGMAGGLLLASPSFAQELKVDCEKKNQVRNASSLSQQFLSLELKKGRKGNCYRIYCPAKPNNKKITKSVFHPTRQLKIESTSKPVKIVAYVKGKAKGSLNMGVYNDKRKPLHQCGVYQKFEVDSPDKWTTIELNYTPKAGSLYANKAVSLMPLIVLYPGSDLLLDDWEMKFIDNKDIVIEE